MRLIGYLATLALACAPLGAARADTALGGGLLAWLMGSGHQAAVAPAFVEPAPQAGLAPAALLGPNLVTTHTESFGGAKVIVAALPFVYPEGQAPQAAPTRQAAPAPQSAFASEPPPPSADLSRVIAPEFLRQEIDYSGAEKPGAIIIDTQRRFLFFILPHGRAIRYGVGVGRPGFEWAGVKHVTRKAKWPDWTPPVEMMLRRPDIPDHMAGGPDNPLGARALYLGSTLYRIHGTNEPWTIGHNVSSGCIRMMNEDVIDLYDRAKIGTKVTVI